ncbi:MAG: pyruvate dehydrogenase (acetyl-transferring) E1 component subunit alpha [Rickettsiales bacterium]
MSKKTSKSESPQSKAQRVYHRMLLMRRFEEKAGQLYGMGKIAGFCHLYIGQEAVVTGILEAADKNDNLISTYRIHGHMLAMGTPPGVVMAELMGRSDGCSKGKGGSMHMFDPKRKFWGGHGIVGAQTSIGPGIAFADYYNGHKTRATFVFMGDGAVHQGQLYEAMNLAKLWDLPVIYIIENNEYAMGTSVERSTKQTKLYKRGEGFGVPGFEVDGMDVNEVEEATQKALSHIRSGKGPIIVEMKTYRYRGHSMSDPAKYRERSEVDNMKEKHDPIIHYKKKILSKSILNEEEFKKIEDQVKKEIAECIEFSEKSPEPDESELYTEIY